MICLVRELYLNKAAFKNLTTNMGDLLPVASPLVQVASAEFSVVLTSASHQSHQINTIHTVSERPQRQKSQKRKSLFSPFLEHADFPDRPDLFLYVSDKPLKALRKFIYHHHPTAICPHTFKATLGISGNGEEKSLWRYVAFPRRSLGRRQRITQRPQEIIF